MRARFLLAAAVAALAATACGGSAPAAPPADVAFDTLRVTIDEVVPVRMAGAAAVAQFTVRNVGSFFLSVPRCGDAISWTLQKLDGPGLESWTSVASTEICQANLRMAPLLLERGESARGSALVPAAGRYRLLVRYAHAIDAATAGRTATSAPFDVP